MRATRKRMADGLSLSLRAVLYQEDGVWFGHCLELDIVAEGKTPKSAMKNLADLCELQVQVAFAAGDVESIFRPAPPQIWKLFFMGEKTPAPPRKSASPLSDFEARKVVLS